VDRADRPSCLRCRPVLHREPAAGYFAETRGYPWADAVTVAGCVTLICGFALWPIALIWANVDVPASSKKEWQS
jgi:hypothetical protein